MRNGRSMTLILDFSSLYELHCVWKIDLSSSKEIGREDYRRRSDFQYSDHTSFLQVEWWWCMLETSWILWMDIRQHLELSHTQNFLIIEFYVHENSIQCTSRWRCRYMILEVGWAEKTCIYLNFTFTLDKQLHIEMVINKS